MTIPATAPMSAAALPRGLRWLRWIGHRRWLRYGLRDRLIRRLQPCRPGAGGEFTVPFFGRIYRGRLDSYIDWVVFFFGAYEAGVLLFLESAARALDRPDTVFVDIGANVGQHTLFMSAHAATIHAFEPYEPVRRRLLEKIADNRLDNVTVHPVGLGQRDERRPFHAPAGENTGTGSFRPRPAGEHRPTIEGVAVVEGDRYFAQAGITRVDLVKIDVEGLEVEVLTGLRRTLRRDRPLIVMELSAETRALLGGENELMALLPDRYVALALDAHPNGYRLRPLAFDRSTEIVLAPCERIGALPPRASISLRRQALSVVGSIILRTSEMRLAGKPEISACLRMISGLSAR